MRTRLASFTVMVALAASLSACGDDDGDECSGDSDCPANSICTPAGVCAPDPGAQTCESDIDCNADAGLDDHLICNTTTNRCTAPVVDRCPEQALVDRVCAVSREESFCVENVLVNCAGDSAECTECENGCTPDGCEEPDEDMGPPEEDMGPPEEDMGPPEEDTGPPDAGPRDAGPPPAECGNGDVEDGEDCDPPAAPGCGELRGCSESCRFIDRVPTCGDGCVDTLEECGETMSGGCDASSVCRGCQCFIPACGDGAVDPGEECGEPLTEGCAADEVCTSGCICGAPVCGNGDAEPGETCGEPGLDCPAGQACMNCVCQPAPSCGDGTADAGEECGETSLPLCAPTSECLNCVCTALCGNGRQDMGETCGEMGLTCAPGQMCSGCHCINPCGNGVLDSGEECDPADPGAGAPPGVPTCTSSTYCSASCRIEARPRVCGNGCQDALETCGEPGLFGACADEDCVNCQCPILFCGNGTVDEGEQCETTPDCFAETPPIGPPPGRGGEGPICPCNQSCNSTTYCAGCQCEVSTCGDGFIEGSEQCEFIEVSGGKGTFCADVGCGGGTFCNPETCQCQLPPCGDGIANEGEYATCDEIADPCDPGEFCDGGFDGELFCFCFGDN